MHTYSRRSSRWWTLSYASPTSMRGTTRAARASTSGDVPATLDRGGAEVVPERLTKRVLVATDMRPGIGHGRNVRRRVSLAEVEHVRRVTSASVAPRQRR